MRVGLCFRHFSSPSRQLPHGGMQQECQRRLPGIREPLYGNRRGRRRERVKRRSDNGWLAFTRCPAHIIEQVSIWAGGSELLNTARCGEKKWENKNMFFQAPGQFHYEFSVCQGFLPLYKSLTGATHWRTYPAENARLLQLTGCCALIAVCELERRGSS